MLSRWLYYWPLLFEVWQSSMSCCWGGYITDHYCLRFDRVVHVVEMVILLTITVWGLTEEYFMLLRWLYYWSLLFEVWQSGSCSWDGYITDHHCWRFDRSVFHVVEVDILLTITIWALTGEWFMLLKWLYYLPLLFEVWQRTVLFCWGGYITDNYYMRFDRGAVHAVEATILLTITVWGLTGERFMLLRWLYYWPLLFEVWERNGS